MHVNGLNCDLILNFYQNILTMTQRSLQKRCGGISLLRKTMKIRTLLCVGWYDRVHGDSNTLKRLMMLQIKQLKLFDSGNNFESLHWDIWQAEQKRETHMNLSVLKGMRLAKRNNVFLLCLAVWISAWLSVDVSKGSSLAPRTPCPSYDTSSPEATVNTPTLTQSCQISVNYLTLVHIDWHWWWNMHREKQTLSIKRCSPLVGSIKWQKKSKQQIKCL